MTVANDSTLDRFVDELLESARVLDDLDAAAPAEAWASGAVAEWSALGADPGELSTRIAERNALASAMIAWLVGGPSPDIGPDWVTDVGTHDPLRAARIVEDDQTAIIIEFGARSGDRHSASVSIVDGAAVDITLGPAELIEAADSTGQFVVETMRVDRAVESVRAALEAADAAHLSDDSVLNLAAMARRFGVEQRISRVASALTSVADDASDELTVPSRDPDDDRYAAGVIRSALRAELAADMPVSVTEAVETFDQLVDAADPDALALLTVAGLDIQRFTTPESLFPAVGAYFAPASLAVHDAESRSAVAELEWADWLGGVIGSVRAGAGSTVDGQTLVAHVNRCPEVTTTIPAAEQQRIAWAFEQVLYSWEVTGVLDADGALTDPGVWLLPRAAIAAWDEGSTTSR